MRAGIAVVGIVLLVIGAVLWYLPLPGTSTGQTQVAAGQGETVQATAPLALLTPQVTLTVTWTASTSAAIRVYSCGSDSSCGSPSSTAIASGSGTSGTLTFTADKGSYYIIVPDHTATINVQPTVPILGGALGLVLLVIGIILLLVGLVARKKQPKAEPAPVEPAPTEPPAQ